MILKLIMSLGLFLVANLSSADPVAVTQSFQSVNQATHVSVPASVANNVPNIQTPTPPPPPNILSSTNAIQTVNQPAIIPNNSNNVVNNADAQAQSQSVQIEALKAKNAEIETQMTNLHQSLLLLNQEMSSLMVSVQNLQRQMVVASNDHWYSNLLALNDQLIPYANDIVVGLSAIFVLFSLILIRGQKKNKKRNDIDSPEEYDFMNSPEAIPAKLDLARAYISMNDYGAAQEVLNDVLNRGNNEQQEIARQLLNQLPVPS